MHPAPSIIIFTVFSGLGFGLLFWLGIGIPDISGWNALAIYFFAFASAVIGLVASTFHLGNPQRAWRAFTQWRSSWLSREGWFAVIALMTMGIYALGIIFFEYAASTIGFIGAIISLVTVFATSMIYAQMKTVPRWNHWTTSALFLTLAVSGGAILTGQSKTAAGLLLLAGILQVVAWMTGDTRFGECGSTIETATQLGGIGKVRLFEPPHTGSNYLLKEMVYTVGRKHAGKLRKWSIMLMCVVPALILLVLPANLFVGIIALLTHLAGTLASRWLFFAEAEHVVGLYYGRR